MNSKSLSNGTVKHTVRGEGSLVEKLVNTKTKVSIHARSRIRLQDYIQACGSSVESTMLLMALHTGEYF